MVLAGSARHVVVVGLMGVGKTTTAVALAGALGRPLSDSDSELLAVVGHAGGKVADVLGVPALHQIERGLLLMALARSEPHVIAAAASVIEDPEIRRQLGDVLVIEVQTDIATIHARQQAGDHRRSMSLDELSEIAARRSPLFADVADLTVDGAAPTDEIVERITTYLGQGEAT